MNEYFRLFANCFLVKGYNRSLIFDSQRMNTVFVPNDLHEIITKAKNTKIEQIYQEYGFENKEIIDEYFSSLIESELGFFSSEQERTFFPEINTQYHSPFEITNSVIEDMRDTESYQKIIPQLEQLGCQCVELIFYKDISNADLENILSLFSTSAIKYVGLILPYEDSKTMVFLKNFCARNLRLNKILVHGSPQIDKLKNTTLGMTELVFVNQVFTNFSYCGNVSKKFFSPSMDHYIESQDHNTCLNQKISINAQGDIKNCPAISSNFGNIKNVTLSDALQTQGYKQMWSISKDHIDVCKDCEFRHICTDCRAYTENPEDQYSKPLKCGYDPYTNEWSDWSTNPLKQKAIEFYEMKDLT